MKTINLQKILPTVAAFFFLVPMFALAQWADGAPGEVDQFAADLLEFINDIIVPLLFAIALVLFIYGVFLFLIAGGGEEDSREQGRRYMFWGIIALVIIVSVWGITNIIAGGLFGDRESIDEFIPEAANF